MENAKVLNSRLEDLMVEAKNKYSALESENAATADNLMSKLKHDAGKESRGLQSILDYPKMSPKLVHHNIYLKYPLENN